LQDILSVALRALSFVFLLQAAGVALFVTILGRLLAGARGAIGRLGRWSALLGLVCVVGHYALEAARMAGETIIETNRMDNKHTAWLKDVVARGGWPKASDVGATGRHGL
jgi:hypothetical protein